MKTDRALLKYFLVYATLACAWLLAEFAWQATVRIPSDTFLHMLGFALFSTLFWFAAILHYRRLKASLETDAQTQLERLKLALDAAQEALWDWSLNQEQDVFFSAAYCANLGYSQAEFGNNQQAWQSHLIPEERERVYRNVMRFIAEGDGNYDSTYRMQHKDGSVRWIRSRGRLIKNSQGVPVRLIGIAQDITAQRAAEERLKQAEAVFASTNEGVLITDSSNIIVYINAAFTRITGYSAEEVLGQTPSMFKSGRHAPEFYQALWAELEQHDQWRGAIWNRRKNGEILQQYQTIRLIRDENGFVSHNVAVFSDISVLQDSPADLSYQAYYDSLTGLANRTQLHERLKRVLQAANHQDQSSAVLLIDLDNFKQINDKLGHSIGDQLLQAVAQRLSTVVRNKCTLARIGSDQFVAVCESLSTANQVVELAEQIIQTSQEPFNIANKQLSISASIGICLLPCCAQNPQDILHNAELALAKAKASGTASFFFAADIIAAASCDNKTLNTREA